MIPSLKSLLVSVVVVAGAILTGTLVVGRNYGPTYYAQYGGNLQQAAAQRPGEENYELYYNHEDRNYYYRQKQSTYHEQNQRYYDEQAAYHHNYIDRQAESYSGSFASRLVGVGRRMWNMVTSGFKRMANGVRRTFYGEPPEEKLFDDQLEDVAGPLGDLFGPSEAVQDIVASNAWTVPAAGLATGLLFQTQIEELVEDLIGPCANWRNVCSDDNVDTCFNGDCYCGSSKGAKCSGTTNICTGGICKCGTNTECTATNVDTCSNNAKTGGTCTCGGNTACSGTTDTCTSGACKCGTNGTACMGSGVCTSGVCKCTVASTDCGVLANTCTSGTCLCGSSAECDATLSDKCDSGTCKCGTNAQCATGITCTGGACVCSASSQCSATTTLTDTCTTGSCVCNTAGTCSTTTSNLCATTGCRCGTTASNVAACSGTTPKCLTSAQATPAVGAAATCQCSTSDTCIAAQSGKILANLCSTGVCKCGAEAACTGTKTCKAADGLAAPTKDEATDACA